MQVRKHKRRKHAAPIGGVYVVMALIGAITVVSLCMQLTSRVLDNSSTKTEIEDFIRPVVMFDPVPFENPIDIGRDQLLLYSMWANLIGEKRSSYIYNENGEMQVPASDLDVAAAKLFGPDVVLDHRSFGDYNNSYYYDSQLGVYNLMVPSILDFYSPRVENIRRLEKDLYAASVGYLPPNNAWNVSYSGAGNSSTPEKYMDFVLRKVKNGYQIAAIRDTDNDIVNNEALPAENRPRPPEPSQAETLPDDTDTAQTGDTADVADESNAEPAHSDQEQAAQEEQQEAETEEE